MSNLSNGGTSKVAVISSESERQTSSQSSSSQDSELYCSESMVSSDGSQPVVSQSTGMAFHKSSIKADAQEENTKTDKERQDPSPETGGVTGNVLVTPKRDAPIPGPSGIAQAVIAEKPTTASQMLAASFSANSNLSQLAELAVGKAQLCQASPGTPMHALLNPNRPFISGQNFPLPSGGQQPVQVPVGFSSYPPGPLVSPSVQFHGLPNSMQIPPPFLKGSIIQLASGELKRVEELKTKDFIDSTQICPELKLETSTIITIQESNDTCTANVSFTIDSSKAQVSLNCPLDHPFFVYDQGWSSCRPELSQLKFKLKCHLLKVGDACIFLSPAGSGVAGNIPLTNSNVIMAGNVVKAANTSMASANQSNMTGTASFPNQLATTTSAQITSGVTLVGMFGQTPVPSVPSTQTVPAPAGQQGNGAGQPQVLVIPAGPSQASVQENLPAGQSALDTVQAVGVVRPQGAVAPHQVSLMDPKDSAIQGAAYYNPITGTLMTALPGQTLVQGSVLPPASVGNGLLMAAMGIVPGRVPPQYVQPGMLYGQHLSEMAQKQVNMNPSSEKDSVESQKDSQQTDTAPPEEKKPRLGTHVT